MFNELRRRRNGSRVFLYAFDLLELNGCDLRRGPIEARKVELAKLLHKAKPGLRLSEHIEGDGAIIYRHAVGLAAKGVFPSAGALVRLRAVVTFSRRRTPRLRRRSVRPMRLIEHSAAHMRIGVQNGEQETAICPTHVDDVSSAGKIVVLYGALGNQR